MKSAAIAQRANKTPSVPPVATRAIVVLDIVEALDAGPILIQAAVPVPDDDTVDTLSARILTEEHRIYSEAIRMVLDGNYRIEGRRVLLNSGPRHSNEK